MSGVSRYELQRRRELELERKRNLAIKDDLKQSSTICNEIMKIQNLMAQDIKDIITESERTNLDKLNTLEKMRLYDKQVSDKFKVQKLKELNSLKDKLKHLQTSEIDKDIILIEEEIQSSENIMETSEKLGRFTAKVNNMIKKEIKKVEERESFYNMFGLITDEDFKDEKKLNLAETFLNLKELGYDPEYDPDSGKIYAKSEGEHDIVAESDQKEITMKFENYEGKSCTKEMQKIEKYLRENNSITPETRIYTDWYSQIPLEKNQKINEPRKTQKKSYENDIKERSLNNDK